MAKPTPKMLGSGMANKAAKKLKSRRQQLEQQLRDAGAKRKTKSKTRKA